MFILFRLALIGHLFQLKTPVDERLKSTNTAAGAISQLGILAERAIATVFAKTYESQRIRAIPMGISGATVGHSVVN
jgi:hypothetical protein